MDKKSFILHIDACEIFNDLDDQFAGKLIKAIVGYQVHGEIREGTDQMIKLLSKSFIQQFKRDDEKYKKVLERNKKNIEKRWEKNKTEDIKKDTSGISGNENHTKSYQVIPTDTKNTDNGSGNGSDSKSGSDLLKEKINKNPLTSILINPKESLQSNFSTCEDLSQFEPEAHESDKAVILANQGNLPLVTTGVPKNKKTASQGGKNGSRIDPDLILSDEWVACAYGACEKRGFDIEAKDIEIEFEKFKNYWLAKSGSGGSKLDWLATWRNWMLNFQKPVYRTSSGYKPYQSKGDVRREDSVAIKNFVAEAEVRNGKKYGIFS